LLQAVREKRAQAIEREAGGETGRHRLVIGMVSSTCYNARCTCGMWALENLRTSHPIDETAARALVSDQHRDHQQQMAVKVTYPSGTQGHCNPVVIRRPGHAASFGIICNRGQSRRTRCKFCKVNWSVARCDFPTGGNCKKCHGSGVHQGYNCDPCAGTGHQMCNKHFCQKCGVHAAEDEDYCRDHQEQAGFGPPKFKREPCGWAIAPFIVNRKCLRESCSTIISAEGRVLFFAHRQRAMCQPCGTLYIEMSE
jgi:hypothetical protein